MFSANEYASMIRGEDRLLKRVKTELRHRIWVYLASTLRTAAIT